MSLLFQMANLVLLVLLLFPGSNLAIESYQNVVFSEQNEISLTRARWLVTFSIDLTPYNAAFQLLKEYIKNVRSGEKEGFPPEFLGDVIFETLINNVNEEFNKMRTALIEIRRLSVSYLQNKVFSIAICRKCS